MALNERTQATFTTNRQGNFWGLVEQKGPWRETESDRKRARRGGAPTLGGGIGANGYRNTGNANSLQLINPYVNSGTKPLPKPSRYAMRSIVSDKPLDGDFDKPTTGRLRKRKVMGQRTTLNTGNQAGFNAPPDPKVFQPGGSFLAIENGGSPASDRLLTYGFDPAGYETLTNADFNLVVPTASPSVADPYVSQYEADTDGGIPGEGPVGISTASFVTNIDRENAGVVEDTEMHYDSRRTSTTSPSIDVDMETSGNSPNNVTHLAPPETNVPTAVPTYTPPVYNKVEETTKASDTAKKDEERSGKRRRSSSGNAGPSDKKGKGPQPSTKRRASSDKGGVSKKGKESHPSSKRKLSDTKLTPAKKARLEKIEKMAERGGTSTERASAKRRLEEIYTYQQKPRKAPRK